MAVNPELLKQLMGKTPEEIDKIHAQAMQANKPEGGGFNLGRGVLAGIRGLPAILQNKVPTESDDIDTYYKKALIKQAISPEKSESWKPTTREEAIAFEREKLGIKEPLLAEKEQKQTKKDELNRATELRKEFNTSKVLQDFQVVDRGFKALNSAYEQAVSPDAKSRIASDQALGVLFQKLLDPQSVVRESEYARTPEGASFFNRIQSIAPQLQKGGLRLADADRLALLDTAKKLMQSSQDSLNAHIDRYSSLASQYEVDPNLILGDIKKVVVGPDGKRYRIIGGDPSDPDIEEIK